MSKAVAVKGDTQAVASKKPLSADSDKSGSWQAVGEIAVTTGEKISVNGKKVELSAEMTWTYQGGTANGIPIPPVPPETVALVANPTKLKDANRNILVEDDEVMTVNGNKIIVTKSQDILKTA